MLAALSRKSCTRARGGQSASAVLLVSLQPLAFRRLLVRALPADEASMRLWKPGQPLLTASSAAAPSPHWGFARPRTRANATKNPTAVLRCHLVHARNDCNAPRDERGRTSPWHKKKASLPAAKRACTTRRRRSALPRPRLSQQQRDRRAAPVRNKNKGRASPTRIDKEQPWPRQAPCSRRNSTSTL